MAAHQLINALNVISVVSNVTGLAMAHAQSVSLTLMA